MVAVVSLAMAEQSQGDSATRRDVTETQAGNNQDKEARNDDRHTVAFVPSRLGAPKGAPWPADLEQPIRLASEWQQCGYSARVWELGGAVENRLYEIAGLMASIGEQLGLSCTAGREYVSWGFVQADKHQELQAEAAKRAWAEIIAHYVLAAGNGLVNLTYRTLALDQGLERTLSEAGRLFPPLSNDRSHWVTANAKVAKEAKQAAAASSVAAIREVADPAWVLLTSDCWRDLCDCRGEDFHRHRAQTAGVYGAGKQSPWRKLEASRTLDGIGGERIGHDVQATFAAQTFGVASNARAKLMDAMTEFYLKFRAAVEATTNLRIEPDR